MKYKRLAEMNQHLRKPSTLDLLRRPRMSEIQLTFALTVHQEKTPRPTKICCVCGVAYKKARTVSQKSWSKSQFCSRKCINVGRVPSTKGKKTGKPAWNSGKECPQTSGEKNGSWKGGIDHKTCRRIALKRDDFTCQECGLKEPDIMQVDHIKSKALFPELRYEPTNLITLCPNCHARKTVRQLRDGISHAGRKRNSVPVET